MLMGFSRHHSDGEGASVGRGVTEYFFAEAVNGKGAGSGRTILRRPCPEILMGDAALFRASFLFRTAIVPESCPLLPRTPM